MITISREKLDISLEQSAYNCIAMTDTQLSDFARGARAEVITRIRLLLDLNQEDAAAYWNEVLDSEGERMISEGWSAERIRQGIATLRYQPGIDWS